MTQELPTPTIKVADLTEEVELRSLAQVVETYVNIAFENKWKEYSDRVKGKGKYFLKSAFGSALLGIYTVVVKVGLII